jgi:carbonyl reductase 1
MVCTQAGVADGPAGVGPVFDAKAVDYVFKCNVDGVRWMTEAFLPLLHERGRVVNVSSGLTRLASEELKKKMLAVKSVKEADALVKDFKVRRCVLLMGSAGAEMM